MRLGIDFGTTRTVVASVDRGNYPVVSFDAPDGGVFDWFPSLLAQCGKQRLYGWEAWARQGEDEWTIVRSLKRVLEDAGPNTILRIDDEPIAVSDALSGMALALRGALMEQSNLRAKPGEKLEVMLGAPANANSNQRFLTAEAFRAAGFDVLGLLNEPSAASLEYNHKNKAIGRILVYDLGGGTFDASLVEVDDLIHTVLASEGISTLGGDDFDEILADLALEAAGIDEHARDSLTQAEVFRLHEECRVRKESLHPNTKKLAIDLECVRDGWGSISVPVADYYDRCRPLMEETVRLVEDMLSVHAGAEIDALYVTGGGSELPLVSRVLRETFGRGVKRSAYTRSATAIGLAIQADAQAGYVLREKFTRFFGVWREGEAGRIVVFDPLFPKGMPLPAPDELPRTIVPEYASAHNIGHFRYLESSALEDGSRPAGDIAIWDEILFPFDPALREQMDLSRMPVTRLDAADPQRIEESYSCDGSGSIHVTIRNLTADYERGYRLGRWAAREETVVPAKRKKKGAKG